MLDDAPSEGPVFFDTNILLYLFDQNSNEKRRIAMRLFKQHQKSGSIRLSLQVVHEFAANLLSTKFQVPHDTVVDLVRDLLTLQVTSLRGEDTLTALDSMSKLGVSFWDGLILAAAKREGCATLYSEGFQHGRAYDSVKVINPFVGT